MFEIQDQIGGQNFKVVEKALVSQKKKLKISRNRETQKILSFELCAGIEWPYVFSYAKKNRRSTWSAESAQKEWKEEQQENELDWMQKNWLMIGPKAGVLIRVGQGCPSPLKKLFSFLHFNPFLLSFCVYVYPLSEFLNWFLLTHWSWNTSSLLV